MNNNLAKPSLMAIGFPDDDNTKVWLPEYLEALTTLSSINQERFILYINLENGLPSEGFN